MKKYHFKDWAGNNHFIKARNRKKARDIAEKEIVIKPCYIVDNLKIRK